MICCMDVRPTALLAVLFLTTACSDPPYHAFCKDLSGEDYEACLDEPTFRHEYARQRAVLYASYQMAALESYPEDLLAPNADLHAKAQRIEEVYQMPNIGVVPDDDNPELVGQVFVVYAAFYAPDDADGLGPSIFIEAEEGFAVAQADHLSAAQIEYLEFRCYLGIAKCRGDLYLRMVRDPQVGWIEPQVVGIDMPKPATEDIFAHHMEFYEDWLERLALQAAE